MLGDVWPYQWGDVHRRVQSILERTRADAATRKDIDRAFDAMLHAEAPREWDGENGPVCSLCGRGEILDLFVECSRDGARVRFSASVTKRVTERPKAGEALVCWTCMYRRIASVEPLLVKARDILARANDGVEHLPLFDKVLGQRLIRRVDGAACALCEKTRAGLRGPPGVTLCLSCVAEAQDAYDGEQLAMKERERRRDVERGMRVQELMQLMWKVAQEDAAGAMQVLERRGDLGSPPPDAAPLEPEAPGAPRDPRASGEGPPSGKLEMPEELRSDAARLARAVMDRIQNNPLAKAAAWWKDKRPTAVSLGWKLMEAADKKAEKKKAAEQSAKDQGAAARTAAEKSAGGAPREPQAPDLPSLGRPPIPRARSPKDEAARTAIDFLDSEVARALKHDGHSDLMGKSGIDQASRALDEKELSRPMLERLLQSMSMLRQLYEVGIQFHDYTGDELIHVEFASYQYLVSRMTIGVHAYARSAMAGGLVVSGGTPGDRTRVAYEIGRIVGMRSLDAYGRSTAGFRFVEAEKLYAMSPDEQAEVRRQMLISPAVVIVFGADDLERFIEETPKRCSARIVTYLFMNGQEHLNLNDGRVHVGPPPPDELFMRQLSRAARE